MQLRQRLQIVQLDVGQQRGPDHAGVVHDMRDGKAGGDIGGGLSGRGGIHQVDLDGMQLRVRLRRLAARERDDLVSGVEHLPADFRSRCRSSRR